MTSNPALDLMAALVLEDGRRWGEAAWPWQWDDARALLDLDCPTPYHFLTRGRGGAKTSDLAGVALAAMLTQAPSGARLYAAAADREQARLFSDSCRGYQQRTPELRSGVQVDTYRVTAGGATLEILPADAASAWGLRPWLLLIDEVAQWPSTPGPRIFLEALTSAIMKNAEARMALLTSAGDPAHWSRRLLEHAMKDELWRVSEIPGPCPWLDPKRVEEQRRRLPESSFRRLVLNEWTASEDRIGSPDDLAACVSLDGPVAPKYGTSYVVAADLGVKHDRSVVGVVHAEPIIGGDNEAEVASRIVLDRMMVWTPTRETPVELSHVEEAIYQASTSYNHAPVVLDPWQAMGIAQRLRKRGVKVEEFTFSSASVGRLAVTLLQLIRNRAGESRNLPGRS